MLAPSSVMEDTQRLFGLVIFLILTSLLQMVAELKFLSFPHDEDGTTRVGQTAVFSGSS